MNLKDIVLTPCAQPDEVNFQMADGVFIKAALFNAPGTVIPQHSHEYDHTSFIATGAAHVWRDDEYLGLHTAPSAVFIKAHCKHTFMTTAPGTQVLCIHNIARTGGVDVHELHELTFP